MTEFSIATPHHRLKGYLATPQGVGSWPGVSCSMISLA
jgi:carboxymethylenebutenolidase